MTVFRVQLPDDIHPRDFGLIEAETEWDAKIVVLNQNFPIQQYTNIDREVIFEKLVIV